MTFPPPEADRDPIGAWNLGAREDLGALEAAGVWVLDLNTEPAREQVPVSFPRVVVGIRRGQADSHAPRGVDIALCEGRGNAGGWVGVEDLDAELDRLDEAVRTSPLAALTMAQLMRMRPSLDFESALVNESLAYAALQSGTVFRSWLHERPEPKQRQFTGEAVLLDQQGQDLILTLNRPTIHNAMSSELRDALCACLAYALLDTALTRIILRGAGNSFSSGGFLDEFGTVSDPAAGHAIRMTRSAARLAHALSPRLRIELHGATMGAGIELGCLGALVQARSDTSIALPEVALGLVPGAGGTASVPLRIGTQRCCWLAISGATIDAQRALAWGLIDEVTP